MINTCAYFSSGLSPGSGPKKVRTWILLEIFSSRVTNLCKETGRAEINMATTVT